MIDQISSKDNKSVKRFKNIVKVGDPSYFVIEGFHLLEMAEKSGYLEEVFTSENKNYKADKIHLCPYSLIKSMSTSISPEPVLGICKKRKSQMFSSKKALLLDRVQDPGNLGTLLRSALSFGYFDIYCLEGTCSIYNPKTIASSQGAIFKLNVFEKLNPKDIFSSLKENNYKIYGSSLKNAKDIEEIDQIKGKFVLCLGNEGKGMKEENLAMCDSSLYIKINDIDSLNVGVAGSILMYELNKKWTL